ncbi:hypothetical protein HDU92_007593 [Lobulomyces angularis]|nr:hypothetical protein HDU92_007593 [Lobulomyces angularis]
MTFLFTLQFSIWNTNTGLPYYILGPLGGNMYNNVVAKLFRYFSRNDYTTIRFNFRGCGSSTGSTSWRGFGEVDDILSVIKYSKSMENSPKKYILIGYSYGSMVMGAAMEKSKVSEIAAFISISYPYSVLWSLSLFNSSYFLNALKSEKVENIKKLFVIGKKDNFSFLNWGSYDKFFSKLHFKSENVTSIKIENADHFWFDKEDIILNVVLNYLKTELPESF